MEAGLELDALIAEKVMGWTMVRKVTISGTSREVLQGVAAGTVPSPYTGYLSEIHIPAYSTDIKAAWDVVMKLPKGFEVVLERETLRGKDWKIKINGVNTYSETAPHAICLAALKSVHA